MNPIGAYAVIKWHDDDLKYEYYISFGDWNEDDPETDSFGIPDDTIFFYAKPEDEQSLRDGSEGWTLIDWEFVYPIPSPTTPTN